ncbi:MAG: hypothetical protein AAFR35_09920 [Pseudomonadota bacterium]
MTHSFPIHFDPLPEREARASVVQCVITPVDRFTGLIVAGISARVPGQAAVARRSLSGHLVFERLIAAAPIRVSFDAGRTGYFTPEPRDFVLPQDPLDPVQRQVALDLRPDRVTDGEAATIRGGVRRAGQFVNGAEVVGRVTSVDGAADPFAQPEFQTRTDERGGFALRLRPPAINQAGGPAPVPVRLIVDLSVRADGVTANRTLSVEDLKTQTAGVIDLP